MIYNEAKGIKASELYKNKEEETHGRGRAKYRFTKAE